MDLLFFLRDSILRVPDFINVQVNANTCSIIVDEAYEITISDNSRLDAVYQHIVNTLHQYAGQRRVKIDLSSFNCIESMHAI